MVDRLDRDVAIVDEKGNPSFHFQRKWQATIESQADAIAAIEASGIADGDKGDITVSGGGTVWTVDGVTSSGISDFDSAVRAQVEAELVAGANITITPSGSGSDLQLTIAGTGGGSGTTITSGATVVDFGAFPGASDTSVTITGQTGILAGSKVKAYIIATATADHTADEHWLETIDVKAGSIVAGTGFTIYAKNTNQLNEPVLEQWANTRLAGPGTGVKQIRPNNGGGTGTRLYGQFTVAWEWY